jgi:hypothetical protein
VAIELVRLLIIRGFCGIIEMKVVRELLYTVTSATFNLGFMWRLLEFKASTLPFFVNVVTTDLNLV